MPQALAFVAPTVFGVGGSAALFVAGAGGVATLSGLGIAASIGGSLLLSAASGALLSKSAPSVDPANIKLNVKQSIGERTRHYGRVRVGGTMTFFRAKSGKFYRVIAHGQGPIDAFEKYILDSREVQLNGFEVDDPQYITGTGLLGLGGNVALVKIYSRVGATNSAYYSPIGAIWPEYDTTHQLNGICTTLTVAESVSAEDYRDVYPRNEPSLEVVLRGELVYDPRTVATAWSDNASLCIADFMAHPDGLNKPGKVDMDTVAQAADEYDELFALAAGGTEKRARLWGSYSLTEQPATVLRRMQAACGADVRLLPSSKIGIYSSKWTPPTVTITRDQVIAVDEWDGGPSQKDRYTELPFVYTDPALGYQSVSGDPWVDAVREAENGETAIGPEANYGFSPSHAQARDMAQRQIEIDNPAFTIKLRLKPSGRIAMFERFVNIDMAELPDVFWRVLGYTLDLTNGGVTLNLASFVPTYRSAANDGNPQELPTPDTEGEIPPPANVTVAGNGIKTAQNAYSAGIVALWDARPSVALSPHVEYARTGTGQWEDWPVTSTSTKAQLAPLADGQGYDVRIYYKTADDKKSAYVTNTNVAATADASPPATAASLAVTDEGGGEARITFRTSVSDSLWKTQIIRDGTIVATTFETSDRFVAIIDAPGAGTHNYSVRSINVSNIMNTADAGPVAVTVT